VRRRLAQFGRTGDRPGQTFHSFRIPKLGRLTLSERKASDLVKTSMAQVVTVRTNIDSEGNMKTIGGPRALPGSISLVTLKTEILSVLSSVSSATTTEEHQQADAAYKKALCTARSVGYRPHI